MLNTTNSYITYNAHNYIDPSQIKVDNYQALSIENLYTDLWLSLIEILREQDCIQYDKILEHLFITDTIMLEHNTDKRYQRFTNFLFNELTEEQRLAINKVFMIKQMLVNLAIKICLVDYYNVPDGEKSYITRISPNTISHLPQINFHLGLLAKETEPGNQSVVRALKNVADAVENRCSHVVLQQAMRELWKATWKNDNSDEISFQLFYADIIYNNLIKANKEIEAILLSAGIKQVEVGNWFNGYTWLSSDRDGRPYDTNEKTEDLIIIMRSAIKKRYCDDLDLILQSYPQNYKLIAIQHQLIEDAQQVDVNKFNYNNPNELIQDLQQCDVAESQNVKDLITKIQCFGFYYLQLEFRDNARMFAEVINEIVPANIIGKILAIDATNFLQLSREDKVKFLTIVQNKNSLYSPQLLLKQYLESRADYITAQLEKYKNDDYIDLLTIDPEYISMLNAKNTIERFELIKKYPEHMHIHGIAETTGPEDPLAVLFIMAAVGIKDMVDIALQPEDPHGANNIIKLVNEIYENPVYKEHLAVRNNRQYIVFGPSDTGKEGGKAMHKANMQMANMHQSAAKKYGIEVILQVITGYEHARGNSCYRSNLKEYGALGSSQTRYMMAGLNEMKSHLLTSKQTIHCLKELYLAHLEPQNDEVLLQNREDKLNLWFKVVNRYRDIFYENPALPKLLKKIVRFDIINATAKGTRPPSRILNIQQLEDVPSAIRAIPWTRAFLLAGIHTEAIGAGAFADYTASDLKNLQDTDTSFNAYVKHIAYATARTDMTFAWQTLLGECPEIDSIIRWANEFSAQVDQPEYHLLAVIDREIALAKRFVYKSLYGVEPLNIDKISIPEILSRWPNLLKEVQWKENNLVPYKMILRYAQEHPNIVKKDEFIKDFFTGCLTGLNTDICIFHPDAAQDILWG